MNPFRIPDMAKQYTDYDMIHSHTELPEFPASRARLLCAFLTLPGQQDEQMELVALAASLVQMGIDTHEMVSVSNDAKEKKAVRSRQLKVLAGDYFSSRFYHLLSQAGQIETIRQLSAAICEVNRLKMTLYSLIKQLKISADEYLQHTVEIRSRLFLGFSRLMEGMQHALWPEILRGFTHCEVLAGEIARSGTPGAFRGSWGYWHILQNGTKEDRKQLEAAEQDESKLRPILLKYNVNGQLYLMLEQQVQQVLGAIRRLDSEKLMQELYHIGEPFLRLAAQPKVSEER